MLTLERKAGESIRIGHQISLTVMDVNQTSTTMRVESIGKVPSFSNQVTLFKRDGEHLKLGKQIRISLVDVRLNAARIGIQAPSSIPVHREEIYAKEFSTAVEAGV